MDKFAKDIQKLLIISDDDNKLAYNSLLMFCEFHNNYLKKPELIEDKDYLKSLYSKFHFGGVQREKDHNIEMQQFISSYFTLVETINIFYSLDINHSEIIHFNIKTISKNTVKPYKTGLLDFIKYLNLYKNIYQFGLISYFDIINKNKKFFIEILNYDKDIMNNYISCNKDISIYISHYNKSELPLLWMIQKLLSSKHLDCVNSMMKILFDNYVFIINSEFTKALLILFTLNIVEHHTKLYKMFFNKFIEEYSETNIEDIELNECKIKESHIEPCPNGVGIRICDNVPEIDKIDPSVYCKVKNNKFLKLLN
jgi:hypothetical protein